MKAFILKFQLIVAAFGACLAAIPSAAGAQPASGGAVVSVHYDTITNAMPAYGYNMTYLEHGQNSVDPKTGKLNPRMLAALKEIRPHWLRFPGGTISNTYQWKRAIGPLDKRIDSVHGWSAARTSYAVANTFGPDEAARMMETVGGKLVICLSFSAETADSAADWVEYMNAKVGANPNGGEDWAAVRAKNGHAAPYGVKHWEIGNESGGKGLKTWTSWPAEGDDNENNGTSQGSDRAARLWAYGGKRKFRRQKAVRLTSWQDRDIRTKGSPRETYQVKFPPAGDVVVRIGPSAKQARIWTRVLSFDESDYGDAVYTLDTATGRIRFGNGREGRLPPKGQYVFVDYTSGPHDGFVGFYRKMKAVDPSIVITGSHLGLLGRAAGDPKRIKLDGHQTHGGAFLKKFPGPIDDDPFTACIGRGHFYMADVIDRTRKSFEKIGVPKGTRISITEFTIAHRLKDSKKLDHAETMAGTLMMALALEAGSRYRQVEIMGPNYLKNTHETAGAHVDRDFIVRGQGRAMQMFTRHFGAHRLKMTAGVPSRPVRWRSRGAGKGEVRTGSLAKVVTLASRDREGKTLYIMGINTTKDETIELTFRIEGRFELSRSGQAAQWLLHADSLTAVNTKGRPNAIRIDGPTKPPVKFKDGDIRHRFAPASVTVLRFR